MLITLTTRARELEKKINNLVESDKQVMKTLSDFIFARARFTGGIIDAEDILQVISENRNLSKAFQFLYFNLIGHAKNEKLAIPISVSKQQIDWKSFIVPDPTPESKVQSGFQFKDFRQGQLVQSFYDNYWYPALITFISDKDKAFELYWPTDQSRSFPVKARFMRRNKELERLN